MSSFFVKAALPDGTAPEAREALAEILTRVASRFSFQGLEDYAVELGAGEKVLGAEREFHDLRGRGKMNQELKIYFEKRVDGVSFRRLVEASLEGLALTGPFSLGRKDWMKEWRKHYRTQIVREGSASLAIVPAWKKAPVRPAAAVKIWPGQAFGTGTHATTRLCLRAFLRVASAGHLPARVRLLDFGAGTGVLALGAMAWAVKARKPSLQISAVAVESDPEALEQAGKNARLNRRAVVLALKMPARKKYDFVFANVLAPVLLRFRGELVGSLAAGGWLVLSGLLASEVEDFRARFSEGFTNLEHVGTEIEGDWASVLFRFTGRKQKA